MDMVAGTAVAKAEELLSLGKTQACTKQTAYRGGGARVQAYDREHRALRIHEAPALHPDEPSVVWRHAYELYVQLCLPGSLPGGRKQNCQCHHQQMQPRNHVAASYWVPAAHCRSGVLCGPAYHALCGCRPRLTSRAIGARTPAWWFISSAVAQPTKVFGSLFYLQHNLLLVSKSSAQSGVQTEYYQ